MFNGVDTRSFYVNRQILRRVADANSAVFTIEFSDAESALLLSQLPDRGNSGKDGLIVIPHKLRTNGR